MKLRQFYVYLLTNDYDKVLYVGVTSDLVKRLYEHNSSAVKGFSYRYNTHKLIYYEICDTAEQAIAREKQLKNWHHDWKLNLAIQMNPELRDLGADFE